MAASPASPSRLMGYMKTLNGSPRRDSQAPTGSVACGGFQGAAVEAARSPRDRVESWLAGATAAASAHDVSEHAASTDAESAHAASPHAARAKGRKRHDGRRECARADPGPATPSHASEARPPAAWFALRQGCRARAVVRTHQD